MVSALVGERVGTMATAMSTMRASERAGFRNVASRLRRNALVSSSRTDAVLELSSRAGWVEILDGEEAIVFEVNLPEVIYLDGQLDARAAAAEADRVRRHRALAERATQLLATLDVAAG